MVVGMMGLVLAAKEWQWLVGNQLGSATKLNSTNTHNGGTEGRLIENGFGVGFESSFN